MNIERIEKFWNEQNVFFRAESVKIDQENNFPMEICNKLALAKLAFIIALGCLFKVQHHREAIQSVKVKAVVTFLNGLFGYVFLQ